ncbi:hypothetical protein Gpo141_00011215 [Globisporangium polare]
MSSSHATVVTAEKQRARLLVWTACHALCILLLLTAWLVCAELLPRQSLASKYDFVPHGHVLPLQAFQRFFTAVSTQCALWTLVLTCVALWCALQKRSVKRSRLIRCCRWLLCGITLAFAILQIIAWSKSTHYAAQMETSKADIGAAFNDFYCETRALQVCAQEDELEKLMVVIGGEQSTTSSGTSSSTTSVDSVKAATLAIWLRCRDLLVENRGRVSSQQLKLLSDCSSTAATDTWCGNHFLSQVNGGMDAVDTSGSTMSPFNANPGIFESLKQEWPTRVNGSWPLAALLVIAIALSWCLKQLTRDATDGFELIDMKNGQRTGGAGSTPTLVV